MEKINKQLWEQAGRLEQNAMEILRPSMFSDRGEGPTKLRQSAQKYEEAGDLTNAYRIYTKLYWIAMDTKDASHAQRLEKLIFE